MTDRYIFEKQLWKENYERILGLDEVGRGCLSGPVVAAGVILNPQAPVDGLADSKTLDSGKREELALEIRKHALFYTVAKCSPAEIDRLNILKASIEAMVRCVEAADDPDYLLVDGNRFTSSLLIPHQCIIKGDDRSASIAAASILAKVYRDRLMKQLHIDYPCYGWDTNVGYPTKAHYEGLKKYGYTIHHRRSFNLKTKKRNQGKGENI